MLKPSVFEVCKCRTKPANFNSRTVFFVAASAGFVRDKAPALSAMARLCGIGLLLRDNEDYLEVWCVLCGSCAM